MTAPAKKRAPNRWEYHPAPPKPKEVKKRGPYMTQKKRDQIIDSVNAVQSELSARQIQIADQAADDLVNAAKLAAELARRRKYRALDFYEPYPKQAEFHALGATKHEVALIAANRSGKTFSGANEFAMHLTGLYPPNWIGRRWDRPIRSWAAGLTGTVVRDVQQKLLFGTPGVVADRGTGAVPKECVDWNNGVSLARGYAYAYDTVQVKHVTGGISTVGFKSYEQGKEKFQADTIDLGWADEEPEDFELYIEFLTRLATTSGLMLITYTPLKGRTALVERFMEEQSEDRGWVGMTLDDAKHFTPEDRERIIASYPAYMRDAKAKGIPMLGSGRIFETPEETLYEDAVSHVPEHWYKLWAIDFGTEHPFAATLLLHDRDADCVHVHAAFRMKGSRPIDHAAAMKPYGADIPVAWPHDGHIRERGSVEPVMKLYKDAGLKVLSSHAAFPDGSISTESGIRFMDDRMKSGRFKVARHLSEWFDEYRHYHRKPKQDGSSEIVKKNDDLMSATRIGCMAIRMARLGPMGREAQQNRPVHIADGLDFDVFA